MESILVPIAEYIGSLHRNELTFGTHDPSEIWIREGGEILLLDVLLNTPEYDGSVSLTNGFSPPEAYGRSGGRFTASADVLLSWHDFISHSCTCQRPLKNRIGHRSYTEPRLFHPRVHAELSAVARRAISLTPTHRYIDGNSFLNALNWSLDIERSRNLHAPKTIRLDVASETHRAPKAALLLRKSGQFVHFMGSGEQPRAFYCLGWCECL